MSDNRSDNNSDASDQYNHGGLLAFLFSMATVICFFLYLVFIHPGVKLGENLQELAAANAAAVEQVVDVSKIAEPWKPNPDMVKHGAKIYGQNCAMCHGDQGKGDGAAGQALNPKPRNLVMGPWKKGGGFTGLYIAISEGLPGSSMSSYAHMSTTDRWALVQFIDSITTAKVNQPQAKVDEFAKTAK